MEVLPGSAVGVRLELAGILITAGGRLHVCIHIAICGHYFSPAIKAGASLQSFPQHRLLFCPLHQKPGSYKSGLWCYLKYLDSLEIFFHEFLGKSPATFTPGLLPPHYRDKTRLLWVFYQNLLIVELSSLADGDGNMLTSYKHRSSNPLGWFFPWPGAVSSHIH